MAWRGFWTWGLGWVAVASLGGCVSEPDGRARMAQLEAENRALNSVADQVEERLLGNQASLEMWSELARRHQHVSAIAVANANEHFNGMVRYLAYQEQKGRRLRHQRVAEAEPVVDVDGAPFTRVVRAGRHRRTLLP